MEQEKEKERERELIQRTTKPKQSSMPRARTRGVPRLTKKQLNAWARFTAPAWSAFKEAWMERGLLYPPTTEQAEMLWPIADARPNDLARWVREAPGDKYQVTDYVLARWMEFLDGVNERIGREELEWQADKIEDREAAPAALARIGERTSG